MTVRSSRRGAVREYLDRGLDRHCAGHERLLRVLLHDGLQPVETETRRLRVRRLRDAVGVEVVGRPARA